MLNEEFLNLTIPNVKRINYSASACLINADGLGDRVSISK
jgi:hypothetical protein